MSSNALPERRSAVPPTPATLDDLHAHPDLERRADGMWWESWQDEDGETRRHVIGDDAATLRWLDFWRNVR